MVILALGLGIAWAQPESGEPREYTVQDTMAVLSYASPQAACVIHSEVGRAVERGGRRYEALDPAMPGSLGEVGVFQLLSAARGGGLLEEFGRRMGPGAEARSPYQANAFFELLRREGRQWNWSAVRDGRCSP